MKINTQHTTMRVFDLNQQPINFFFSSNFLQSSTRSFVNEREKKKKVWTKTWFFILYWEFYENLTSSVESTTLTRNSEESKSQQRHCCWIIVIITQKFISLVECRFNFHLWKFPPVLSRNQFNYKLTNLFTHLITLRELAVATPRPSPPSSSPRCLHNTGNWKGVAHDYPSIHSPNLISRIFLLIMDKSDCFVRFDLQLPLNINFN